MSVVSTLALHSKTRTYSLASTVWRIALKGRWSGAIHQSKRDKIWIKSAFQRTNSSDSVGIRENECKNREWTKSLSKMFHSLEQSSNYLQPFGFKVRLNELQNGKQQMQNVGFEVNKSKFKKFSQNVLTLCMNCTILIVQNLNRA